MELRGIDMIAPGRKNEELNAPHFVVVVEKKRLSDVSCLQAFFAIPSTVHRPRTAHRLWRSFVALDDPRRIGIDRRSAEVAGVLQRFSDVQGIGMFTHALFDRTKPRHRLGLCHDSNVPVLVIAVPVRIDQQTEHSQLLCG